MREIKFRAYDPVLGMCEVKSIDFDSQTLWVSKDNTLYELSFENSPPIEYTGLKDKNGREIYKGDIIDLGGKNIARVEWVENGFVLVLPFAVFQLHSGGKVIGNIYENPELAPSEEEK